MLRTVVVSAFCLLAMPSFAQPQPESITAEECRSFDLHFHEAVLFLTLQVTQQSLFVDTLKRLRPQFESRPGMALAMDRMVTALETSVAAQRQAADAFIALRDEFRGCARG